MTTVTENDLREIKDSLTEFRKEFRDFSTGVTTRLSELEKNQIRLEAELKGSLNTISARLEEQKIVTAKIPDLTEKVGELKNWKQIAIIVFTAAVTSFFWIFRDGKL